MKPADEVILHEEAGEAFLLHVPSGRYFGLNESGLVIWKALQAGEDPVEELGRRWPDVSVEDRQADADGLVQELIGAGLVHADEAPGSALS
jgi:Coenzyme PQQ synthesis protein D (PqqD)